ncbi:MAG: type II toxin-antitoxin system prevent-host-death family antitoxin [Candidatus Sumerlaeota bacterium]|nr:type II toxin-antitoxin system prevent-host-death family antitoxin [Candidatus Sumerlaeota bacterium]
MNAITYSEVSDNLADTLKRVCRDHDPVIIKRKRADSVVLISLKDFDSLSETAHLLRSPRNARRLMSSVRELKNGKGRELGTSNH